VDTKKGIAVSTERLDYDRQAKLSRMSGPTVMEDKRNKVVIKGSYIEDDGQSEITVIQVGVRILKEDMACRAEYAYYRRKENILELSGLPVIVKGNDEYRASRISVDMDSEEITLDGNVKGKVIQEGKSPSPSPSPSSAPSTASASALPSPDPSASPSFSPASPPPVEMGAVP
jgi:lipopolysaccharide export system protein LptA